VQALKDRGAPLPATADESALTRRIETFFGDGSASATALPEHEATALRARANHAPELLSSRVAC